MSCVLPGSGKFEENEWWSTGKSGVRDHSFSSLWEKHLPAKSLSAAIERRGSQIETAER